MKKIKIASQITIASIVAMTSVVPVDASSSTSSLKKQISELKKENALLKKKNTEYKNWEKGLKKSGGLLKSIKVLEYPINKVEFFKDAQKLFPTLSNGSPFKTYVIDKQLYAPIQAVGTSLYGTSKEVTWDESSKRVYFGVKSIGNVISMDKISPNEDSDHMFNEISSFSLYNKEIIPNFSIANFYKGHNNMFYDLDGNYEYLRGTFAVPYSSLGQQRSSSLEFYEVDNFGEDKLLQRFDSIAGQNEIQISVDVTGVDHLKIRLNGSLAVFYDYSLTGFKF